MTRAGIRSSYLCHLNMCKIRPLSRRYWALISGRSQSTYQEVQGAQMAIIEDHSGSSHDRHAEPAYLPKASGKRKTALRKSAVLIRMALLIRIVSRAPTVSIVPVLHSVLS